MLQTRDDGRIRVLTLARPEALNAFNEALYDATTEALAAAAAAPEVAVVVLTGTGRAFSAGTDVAELAARTADPDSFKAGAHGFPGLIDELTAFPKPLLCAVNGLALGIGATLLGFADLVLMSTQARIRCPFTDLAVAPEAASSYLFPLMLGRQQASWLLMSSEWFTAADCERMGLAWRVVAPDDLLEATLAVAHQLAAKPIASLIETKRTIVAGHRDAIAAARARENVAFSRLLGAPASLEALTALAARRPPDFAAVDAAHPVDVARHRAD
ncbi:enoyl-CoA hydratase/isomerase family protein [Frankia sp. CNm7]|uniref:Enoyl-CoA hydratase/isomerase family protein n=1 Tax=Frankia nepalensis TaxID=1836974 RepID=A0A937RL36_9ACTN|nr:enoyl-CoA hydratase-related protein [Frankia nepalensis]MBL7498473.1 enoyl-CoA hydratase/isomerase family protein [Frankia nepalensis]MBL7509494.1 enoyl-CoA hydratase/isomerase family protein [Frankia nepalensis]MBL7520753.1 enoyl-CoA hydratase/isomerase family protein [Frankia nepalensis]MBL7629304.1 enoyl-CoA hydratase/isomerase family protein [Frankia nepalensis]